MIFVWLGFAESAVLGLLAGDYTALMRVKELETGLWLSSGLAKSKSIGIQERITCISIRLYESMHRFREDVIQYPAWH